MTLAERQLLREILERGLAQTAQAKVFAFGSRVEGNARADSDLDLVVIASAPIPIGVLESLREDFEQSNLPYRIDLLDQAQIPAAIRDSIQKLKQIQVYP